MDDTEGPVMIWGRPVYRARKTMREFTEEAAAHYDLTFDDLMGRARTRAVSHARQDAWRAIYETGHFSLPQIGRQFGRDHSTILWGVRRSEDRLLRYEAGLAA